jgi:uncharacterized protein with FMN-binding domain
MKKRRSGSKVANSLVAVSSAAVLSVYAAGYTRTRSAADILDGQTAMRRPAPMALPVLPVRAAPVPAGTPVLVASVKPAPVSVKPAPEKAPVAAEAATAPETAQPAAAPAPAAAPIPVKAVAPVPESPYKALIDAAAAPWKDGRYEGWGTCRHGDLQVTVIVDGGHISSAAITQCLTRYSCDIIEKLPGQVVTRQSADVSYVSGATQSTDAYYWAVIAALGKAK